MFRPKNQPKMTLVFLVLVSALFLLAVPVFARNERSNNKSNEAAARRQSASQSAPSRAPAPQAQRPSSTNRSRNSTVSRNRTVQSQSKASSRNSASPSRSSSSRITTMTVRSKPGTTTVNRNSTRTSSSSVRTVTARPNTSSNKRTSISNNSNTVRSISVNTRQPAKSVTTKSSPRNNVIINTKKANPLTGARQPAASSNIRVSSNISSRIGESIGTQSHSTTTVRNQQTKSSTKRITSSVANILGTQKTSPPTVVQRSAASSDNRINSNKTLSIGSLIAQPVGSQRNNRQKQQADRSRQQQAERERQQQAEKSRQQQAERERQQQAEKSRQQRAERERQQQAERTRQQQAERERQQQAERTRQQQAERERQQQAEKSRQQQAEREKQQQMERSRQQQAEQERRQQSERAIQQEAGRAAERTRQQETERTRTRQNTNRNENPRSSIGRTIGEQNTQNNRDKKPSIINSTNRNQKIIESVKRNYRTPPSDVTRQPAASSNNRISSIDRASSRIGNVISPERTLPSNVAERPAAGLNNRNNSRVSRRNEISNRQQNSPQIRAQKTDSVIRDTAGRMDTGRTNRKNNTPQRMVPQDTDSRNRRPGNIDQDFPTTRNTKIINQVNDRRVHRYEPTRPSRLVYRDQPYTYTRDSYRHDYSYVDYYDRVRYRSIQPTYRFVIRYNRGPSFTYRYFYPYYHRKYVFISLGGYWPTGYRYIRYYWYGSHPYYWCGYYPIAREVRGTTYNYYTYNYYGDTSGGYASSDIADSQYYENLIQQPVAEPQESTLADTYFEEAVTAFEENNYSAAIEKFAMAMELAPDDMILPFAYSQSLFAAERYSEAAQVLRTALQDIDPDKQGVFFPRGLYPDEDILLTQIDQLAEVTEVYSFDSDLQLLLGYQLLGIGEYDEAFSPLINASLDMENAQPANVLLRLLENIKTTETDSKTTEPNKVENIESKISEPLNIGIQNAVTQITPMVSAKVEDDNKFPLPNAEEIPDKAYSKTKGGILFASLFVLAGSTGIGHYLKH